MHTPQLNLNKENASEHSFASSVTSWALADITDLSQFDDPHFDSLVAYGGPLSYALDHRVKALKECRRVLKQGGYLLLSVMSLWGTVHRFLDGVLKVPVESNRAIIKTGDIIPFNLPGRDGHYMHLFRSKELRELLEENALHVKKMSASNFLSLGWDEELSKVRDSVSLWDELLELELEACQEEQSLNAGTHIIAVAKKG